MEEPNAPRGWYVWDDHLLRYWDGQQWTDEYRPRSGASPVTGTEGGGLELFLGIATIAAGIFGLAVGFSLPSREDVGLLGGSYIKETYLTLMIAVGGLTAVLGLLLAWASLDKKRDNGGLVAFALVAACCAAGGGLLLLGVHENQQQEQEQEQGYDY